MADQAAEAEEVVFSVKKKKIKNIRMFKFSVIDVINILVIDQTKLLIIYSFLSGVFFPIQKSIFI